MFTLSSTQFVVSQEITVELSQCILNGLEMISRTLSSDIELFNQTLYDVGSKQEKHLPSIVRGAIKVRFALFQDVAPWANVIVS